MFCSFDAAGAEALEHDDGREVDGLDAVEEHLLLRLDSGIALEHFLLGLLLGVVAAEDGGVAVEDGEDDGGGALHVVTVADGDGPVDAAVLLAAPVVDGAGAQRAVGDEDALVVGGGDDG